MGVAKNIRHATATTRPREPGLGERNAEASPWPPQASDLIRPRHGHVLVVDDDPTLRKLIREVLNGAGYAVTECASGVSALDALARDSFDAVLSDVRMPDMDGLKLLRCVREKDLDLPVVLITGGPSIEGAVEAVAQGALEYLIKPVSTEKLVETTDRAIKLGKLSRLKREALQAAGYHHLLGDRAGLEAAFGRALDSLWMACQPIVHSVGGSIYAHEVLLRTEDPAFPHPASLLGAAERLKALPRLGAAARTTVGRLLASGALPGHVFINVHPLDLDDSELYDPNAPLSAFASRVVLEITERTTLDGIQGLAQRIRELREGLGYRIAIDDLGAGYSGLSSFAALSPDIVKLDVALIRGVDHDPVRRKLVESMTRLCRDLGVLVVAEGIETAGEHKAAVRAGCDFMQGFLFGRPSRPPAA